MPRPDSPGGVTADEPSAKRQCAATTTAGAPCRAWALPDAETCFTHDGNRQDQVRAARSKGAVTTNKLRAIHGHREKLDNVPALVRYVSRLVHDVAAGELDQGVARTLIYALTLQRGLIETSDLEARLSQLEARILATGKRWPA